jgi:hypothetical protein
MDSAENVNSMNMTSHGHRKKAMPQRLNKITNSCEIKPAVYNSQIKEMAHLTLRCAI